MSSSATRIPASVAYEVAQRFMALLDGAVDRVQIAGSLRRSLPTVGDIEVVCVPKIDHRSTDMFAEITQPVDLLAERMDQLVADGVVQKRPRSDGKTLWGSKLRYLTFERTPVDLFSPNAERFGLILFIRTGPAAYSHQLVTELGKTVMVGRDQQGNPVMRRGRLPRHLQVKEGWLTYRTSGERIPTPEESDFFKKTGLRWVNPEDRR